MKVALVLNGDDPSREDLKLLGACDAIVCADGAAQALLRAEYPPTVIVGDLDSLGPDAYNWADALNIPIERHPVEKDETDGELALKRCFEYDPNSILILGGHGGRSAMFLANLKLLRRCHDRGIEAAMIGQGESIRYLSPGSELSLAGRTGSVINTLAMDSKAIVDMHGTEWDGDGVEIGARTARGVSNTIVSDGAKITVHEGTVLIIVERRQQKEREKDLAATK